MTQPATTERARLRGLVGFGCVVVVLLAFCTVCVWVGAGGSLTQGIRLDGLLNNKGFVRTLCICALSVVLFAGLCVWTLRLSRRIRAARGVMDGQSGTVLLEFILVLGMVLPLAAIMVQSSLMMGGYLSVNYASYCAARAAIVYIPRNLDTEPRNILSSYDDPSGSEKVYQVWNAGVWAVMPVSDGSDSQASSGRGAYLETGIQRIYSEYGLTAPKWATGGISRKLRYAEENTSVRIDPSRSETGIYGEHEDVTVHLSHDMLLNVPYAAKLMALVDDTSQDLGNGSYTITVEIPTTLTNEGADDKIDIEEFPDDDEDT